MKYFNLEAKVHPIVSFFRIVRRVKLANEEFETMLKHTLSLVCVRVREKERERF